MSDIITYHYNIPSVLHTGGSSGSLRLSGFNETAGTEMPVFFDGKLQQPYVTARCLIALSNVVKASFSLSTAMAAMVKDPIITAGNNKLRFEGFSLCAGVYARVDLLPGSHTGDFPASGTVNVDFNQPMINALGAVGRNTKLQLQVGNRHVSMQSSASGKVTEKKVPLPVKWLKGLTSVQLLMAGTEQALLFNKMQLLQLFQGIPSGQVKTDYYLFMRGGRPQLTPVKMPGAVCIGGIHRLKLLEPLLPLADELRVYAREDMQCTVWQLHFGPVRFSLALSREAWRGFSGEGAALESLIADIPESWITRFDQRSYENQEFNITLRAVKEQISFQQIDNLTARLAAMGLLGYDTADNTWFYRRLPFRLSRLLSLNPRMKGAEQLLTTGGVTIIAKDKVRTEARVAGTVVTHTVILESGKDKCTCTWFSRNQGERGDCKHILAVKKKLSGDI
ncbi:SWIM zinc finger family protein [Chitinophaga sp. Mgbs1]|uniref:SWIM zinc finger family protein n=1 Tax=Chitinophaga solisilvae TaxID=1233460 RepID=A0A3S1CZD2_9BACT|nr:SWIM zinc finger family protein [Chitinophaga solisilvae]